MKVGYLVSWSGSDVRCSGYKVFRTLFRASEYLKSFDNVVSIVVTQIDLDDEKYKKEFVC